MKKINIDHSKNEDAMKLSIATLNRRLDEIAEGGGAKKVKKHKARGKMTARERVSYLIDPGSNFTEIGALHVIVGSSLSVTVTSKLHIAVLP